MIIEKITTVNLRRLRYLLIAVFVIESLFLLQVERIRLVENVHELVLVSYLLHLILAVFSGLVLLIIWFKRNSSNSYIHRISGLCAFIVLVIVAVISLFDQITHGHVTLFTMHLLAFGLLIYIKPPWNFYLYTIPFIIFMTGVITFQNDPQILTTHLINGLIIYLSILFTSTMFYIHKRNEIISQENFKKYTEELAILATIDPLTEIPNRRFFDTQIQHEIAINKRYNQVASLLLVDIDHFKNINDTYGHDAGDAILKELARLLKTMIRESDTLARWGGEEFMFLLSHTDLLGASVVANRIKETVTSRAFTYKNILLNITLSIGVARLAHENIDSLKTSYENVDKALYHAKSSGRNTVVLYPIK